MRTPWNQASLRAPPCYRPAVNPLASGCQNHQAHFATPTGRNLRQPALESQRNGVHTLAKIIAQNAAAQPQKESKSTQIPTNPKSNTICGVSFSPSCGCVRSSFQSALRCGISVLANLGISVCDPKTRRRNICPMKLMKFSPSHTVKK